jgi:hypothetical protein
MSVPANSTRHGPFAEVRRLRSTVLAALDRLYAHETAAGAARLRLVWSAGGVASTDSEGEELRATIARCGWNLWSYGGQLELFAAVREMLEARPSRQAWYRTQLQGLWGDIGAVTALSRLKTG